MKKLLTLTLAFLLAGCAAVAPVPPTAAPTSVPPTPAVIIATVLVPAPATQAPAQAPTEAPTEVPAATQTPQVIVVTATGGAPTQAPSNPSTGGASGTATATLPADAGGSLFTNLTRSGSYFNLRCLPQDITFGVSTSNPSVTEVDLFYHMEDLTTQPPTISAPKNLARMNSDKNGNFTLDVNTMMLSPDLRTSAKAWFDYQFVGINKLGDRVGSSGVISQQVLYLKDCP